MEIPRAIEIKLTGPVFESVDCVGICLEKDTLLAGISFLAALPLQAVGVIAQKWRLMSEIRDAVQDKCTTNHSAHNHCKSNELEFTYASSSLDALFNIGVNWSTIVILLITSVLLCAYQLLCKENK